MSDLISREDVKEVLRNEWVKLFPVELDPFLSLAIEKIENIPSAEPKRGKWIIDTNDSELINCSCCRRSEWSECFEDIVKSFNYCPNCGAKMEAME